MARVKSVEYEKGFGWIARNPATGEEILPNFRWASREIARTVVLEARILAQSAPEVDPAPVPAPKPFTFADPVRQAEWERHKAESMKGRER